ncbi:MAG: serine/threonine protein kinase, partial [Holophagales bacterium]|nr:serine/threonine protein kinase [Holophagales bacterium]
MPEQPPPPRAPSSGEPDSGGPELEESPGHGERTPVVATGWDTPPPAGGAPRQMLPAPERLGRYAVLELLGVGGMGAVYAAYDPRLDRKVALKLLHPEAPSAEGDASEARRRLERHLVAEAQALARLADPHVVTVFDVGSFGNTLFVAMEYVPGEHLLAWLRREPRPPAEIRRIFRQAGRGLAAAHDAGLVHRDFKANNVMVRNDGAVRVLDFGLARLVGTAPGDLPPVPSEPASPSRAGPRSDGRAQDIPPSRAARIGAGTPSYMAPEQMAGEEVGPAADVFSFCVTYYQALFGELPHPARDRDPGRPEDWRIRPYSRDSEVQPWLYGVLARGLAYRSEDRPASMAELLEELDRDPYKRRLRVLGVAAALTLIGGAFWAQHEAVSRRSQLCQGGEARLEGAWDPSRSVRVRAAFGDLGSAYA